MGLTSRELAEVEKAGQSGRQVVMFVHGLWLLAGSWQPWRAFFEEKGYATIAPGWPDDPETVEEALALPDRFAKKRVGQIRDYLAQAARALKTPPILIGHSFGGLLVQQLAGMGLSAGTVAIDPAPFRGVLPLPMSAFKAAFPVLSNPANFGRAIALTPAQFRFAFANVVSEAESEQLHRTFSVPGSGRPMFQAAFANLNFWTDLKVDTRNTLRGPMLVISGENDNTVPRAVAHAAFRLQQRNRSTTEFHEMPNRGHSLVIDSGWKEVAEKALEFLQRTAGGSQTQIDQVA